MRKIKLKPYIKLGFSVRYLLDVSEGLLIQQRPSRDAKSILEHLNEIESELRGMGLTVTLRAFRKELGEFQRQFIALPDDAQLSLQQAELLRKQAQKISDVLFRYESDTLRAFIISEKRISVEKLLYDVGGLFGNNVFYALPELAQYDFVEAGKAIAFEVPTAAVFHSLRGTECVFRSYYATFVTVAGKRLDWGIMENDLRNVKSDPPHPALLDNLKNIRISFRNPTAHPEMKYDLDEAQDVFNLCVEIVNRMTKDLFHRKIWSEPNLDPLSKTINGFLNKFVIATDSTDEGDGYVSS